MTSPIYEQAIFEAEQDPHVRAVFASWRQSTLWEQRLLRKRIKDGAPRFLYKYIGFKGTFDKQNLSDWIVKSTFRLSKPIEFNDPFDMHGVMIVEGSEEELQQRLIEVARRKAPAGATEDHIMVAAAALAANMPREVIRKGGQDSYEKQRQKFGVACFSTNPKNVLLWSHYGAGHSGVCLQFNVARDYPVFGTAFDVKIATDLTLPTINWMKSMAQDIGTVFFQKNSWWDYEKERRIVLRDQGGKYVAFRRDALSRIILGCNIKACDEAYIDELLAHRASRMMPSVSVYRAEPHQRLAKLVIRRRTEAIRASSDLTSSAPLFNRDNDDS
jgi:hypothetical protein